jgi:hypothetical protein
MNRTTQILGAVALAYLGAGCGASPEAEPDAGPLVGVGFHHSGLSQGTATLSGAFTGTANAVGFAFSIPTGFLLPDGGNSGPYIYVQVSNALPSSGPSFGCTFLLYFSTALGAGIYTPTNVSGLQCTAEYDPADGGTSEFWGNIGDAFGPPSVFELNLTSPGPADVSSSGTNWFTPSGTVSVYMAPGPEQVEGFGFDVTVAPLPCPPFCAPNSP